MVSVNPCYITPDNVEQKTDEWLKKIYSLVWSREHLKIIPEKCVLLVIDMLNYFARPDGRAYLPTTRTIIPQISRLLKAWQKISAPVVFTRHCHQGEHDLGMLGQFWTDYIRCQEDQSEIIEEFQLEKAKIIRKTTYDAFYNTELQNYLHSKNVQQVLITGVLTQMCCETTARSAFVRGFEVYFAADATATSAELFHINSLLSLASSVAVVKKTDHFMNALEL
ncbi:isochorismatase family protein [candidate division CSSED10-310 bacterium]|uniref:Isochorismatase family protein n=1 Tax=candidate division CSSED10-310 bacterium TaxID=2855610 RepID=A0ABV6YRL5_UNCC1